jgi:Zn-dependent protease/CBS domain-containing protein
MALGATLLWLTVGTGDDPQLIQGLLALILIASVAVHELGHVLVGRLCGVQTRSLTLYPFGGVESLSPAPTPKAESLIALGGPIANCLVVLPLVPFVLPLNDLPSALQGISSLFLATASFFSSTHVNAPLTPAALLGHTVVVNGVLALFNALPALPLDGGRVLKAVLTLLRVRRTHLYVSRMSQLICLMMAVTAFFTNETFLYFGAFIMFFGALQEYVRAEGRSAAAAFLVTDAMIPLSRLESFTHGTTVSAALKLALTSLQPLFPVQVGNTLVGVVLRDDILEHAATEPDAYLSAITLPTLESVTSDSPLSAALTLFESTGSSVLIVNREGEFIGILVQDRVAEFLIMKSLPQSPNKGDDVPWSVPM